MDIKYTKNIDKPNKIKTHIVEGDCLSFIIDNGLQVIQININICDLKINKNSEVEPYYKLYDNTCSLCARHPEPQYYK